MNRRFLLALLAIAAVAFVLRVYVAARTFMEFDEWQQVFMASAPRWQDLTYELRAEAHPPLFYLLLKLLLALGHGQLWYRSIAIIPGTGSVVLIGLIGRRLFQSSAAALLSAAALALSAAAITISVEVRQYQLAVFLILAAFHAFVRIWAPADSGRARNYVVLALASTLAVSCHYSAILFVGACFLTAVVWQILSARWDVPRSTRFAAALALPSVVFAAFYLTHVRRQPIPGYLYDFYWRWTPHEKLSAFLLRNIQNFGNLFSPVPVASRPPFLLLAGAAVAGSALLLFQRRRPVGAAILPVLVAAAMVLELAGLSVAQAYPFGGLLRHQYLAAPFLLLGVFVVFDRVPVPRPSRIRPALQVLIGLVLVANLILQWPTLIVFPGEVIYSEEYNAYRSAFPNAQAVYVDHWGVIGYFIHTDYRRRRFVRRIADQAAIDQYDLEGPQRTQIFYDKTRHLLDLADPSLYRSFAECLRQSGLRELTLFFFTPGDAPLREPGALRQTIARQAADHGLTATSVVIGKTTVFAAFQLNP